MQNELIILSRTFDLLAWLVPKAERFPRVHRQTVVARLINTALDLQDALILAQYDRGHSRKQKLLACDNYLILLKAYLRLAHHWQWLNDGQYQHVSKMVAEIGRLLGGWIKQSTPRT